MLYACTESLQTFKPWRAWEIGIFGPNLFQWNRNRNIARAVDFVQHLLRNLVFPTRFDRLKPFGGPRLRKLTFPSLRGWNKKHFSWIRLSKHDPKREKRGTEPCEGRQRRNMSMHIRESLHSLISAFNFSKMIKPSSKHCSICLSLSVNRRLLRHWAAAKSGVCRDENIQEIVKLILFS